MPGAVRRRIPEPKTSQRLTATLLVLPLLLIAGTSRAAEVRSLEVQPSPVQMTGGQARQFFATATFRDDTVRDVTQSVLWSSGSTRTATVSNTRGSIGIVTAVGPGSVKIKATYIDDTGDKTSASADLTVLAPPIAAITTKPSTKNLEVGLDTQFKATAVYVNDTDSDVTDDVDWSSSNPAVASVDNSGTTKGMVRPRQVGGAVITARDPGSGITNTDGTVNVRSQVVAITVEPRSLKLAKRLKVPIRAYGNRADGTRSNLTTDVDWTSLSPGVATVGNGEEKGGVVRTLNNGTAVIRAVDPKRNLSSAGAGDATVVVSGLLAAIHVRPDPLTLGVGDEKNAKAIGVTNLGEETSDLARAVEWSVSNATIASVGNTAADRAEVTGKKRGTATLRAVEPESGLQSPEIDNLTVLGAIQSIALETGGGLVGLGETLEYKVRATYEGGVTGNISDKCSWTSARPGVAKVSDESPDKGIVTGVKKSKTVITADCTAAGAGRVAGQVQVIGNLIGLDVTPATYSGEAPEEKKFRATGRYDDGNTRDLNKLVAWSSSDPTVVQIDSLDDPGASRLLRPGVATVTAAHPKGFQDSAVVTVEPGLLSLEVVPTGKTIRGSTSLQMRAQGKTANGDIRVVSKQAVWSSSNERVARVSNREGEQGLVFGGGQEGTATIMANYGDGLLTAEATITIQGLLTSFELLPKAKTIPLLQARAAAARARFSDGSTKRITRNVVYTSSNTDAVLVSNEPGSQGMMTAVGRGTSTITAVDPSTGLSATNAVEVTVP